MGNNKPGNEDEALASLREDDIPVLRQQYGQNIFETEKKRTIILILTGLVKEPMFILLSVAAALYFILNQPGE
jgi:P-type Ca2+ transporter type 2C